MVRLKNDYKVSIMKLIFENPFNTSLSKAARLLRCFYILPLGLLQNRCTLEDIENST